MHAMVFRGVGKALTWEEIPYPKVTPTQALVEVHTCALCRTDLHIIEGELQPPQLPLILGHQIVGRVKEVGEKVQGITPGMRVGIPWFHCSCHRCDMCQKGKENLCNQALFTGFHRQGGFAEYCVAESEALYPLPSHYDDLHVAPLLCGGIIGYRAYKAVGKVHSIALYGFGSAAHILTQFLVQQNVKVYAFTRTGDKKTQEFAKTLGATWAGSIEDKPPTLVDAACVFAPVGSLMTHALTIVKKGGVVVSAGIHMSDIPAFPYALLWGERSLTSIAHATRHDGEEFLQLAMNYKIKIDITTYPLKEANQALEDLKNSRANSSIVLMVKDIS